jgi:hypothetical protein
MSRRTRHFAALFAMLAILFTQLAVAAYACPMESAQSAPPPIAGDCEGMGMDAAQPGLCQAYCERGDQSLDKASVVVPDQMLVGGMAAQWKPFRETRGAGSGRRSALERYGAASIAPLQGRLRI